MRGNFSSPHHRDTSGAGSTGGTCSRLGSGGSNKAAASVTAAAPTRVEIDAQVQEQQSLRSYSEPIKTVDMHEG